jgi:hypothetical protein
MSQQLGPLVLVTLIVATGAYAGSILVAIFGIQNMRKDSDAHAELMILK